MKLQTVFKFFHWWGPYFGTGIRVDQFTDDFMSINVSMKLKWYNKNYVGTHFGGSLYAMCDPFYMLMLIQILGKKYIVWDKAAAIDYRSPGKGKVTAHFKFDQKEIEEIKRQVEENNKYIFDKEVNVLSEDGTVVAKVTKTLYIREKQ